MDEDRLWFLLARNLSGEASPTEAEELRLLLRQNPDKQYLTDIINTYFNARASETENAGIDFNQRLQRIILAGVPKSISPVAPSEYSLPENSLENKRRGFSIRQFLPYAAAVMGIGFTVWLVYRSSNPVAHPENPMVQTSEVMAKPGARTKLVLPDGTQVWLNSGSKLHYNNDFNTRLREVNLEGEAFFDVVKDAAHPFIVHTSTINVKVLGTAFNVKSYPRDEVIETTLLRGLIEITRKDDPSTPKVILKPNEKLIINKTRDPVHLTAQASPHADQLKEGMSNISVIPIPQNIPDSDKAETSWMYNKLVFDGDSFEE
ncbi:MAG: FecR family protein, partial [Bacteroidota bacterium]|nr:FecR family protein [Bacteroidota bacterium]